MTLGPEKLLKEDKQLADITLATSKRGGERLFPDPREPNRVESRTSTQVEIFS